MAPRARIYIASVVLAATGILAASFAAWQPTGSSAFWIYLLSSMVAAALKVTLPGLPNTMSAGFFLLLASVVQLPPFEVAVIAVASAIVQCLWRPKRTPAAVQVAFSAGTLVISATFAQAAAQAVSAEVAKLSVVTTIVVAAFLLYTANTLLVAAVISLVDSRPLRTVWQQCHLWAFPYFICGAILLDVSAALNTTVTWREVLLLLPLMLLVHLNYRILASRFREREQAAVAKSAM